MLYLLNALPMGALPGPAYIRPLGPADLNPREMLLAAGADMVSAIGHADTAHLVERMLDWDAPLFARVTVRLQPGDRALIAAYTGARLPKGCTTLPEGAALEWWIVETLDLR